jgi:xylulokinase
MTEVTVGIDIGTTSVKAVAADGDGNVVARGRVRHRLLIPAPGRFEHDADEAWRHGPRAVFTALDVEPSDVRAVSVAAMVPSLAAVDAGGVPVTPGLLYGDERGRKQEGEERGPIAEAGEALAFLRWARDVAPEAAGFWPAQAVANRALAGEAVLDTTTAATTAPLFDWGTGAWSEQVAAATGIRVDQLPRLVPTAHAAGRVDGDGPTLASGCIDAFAEQLVAGADDDGDVLVILGTTLIVWVVTSGEVDAPGYYSIPHTAPGKMLVGGPSNSGGLFLDWVGRLLADAPKPADPAGVPVWAPYPRGERVPFHDPQMRAAVAGLDLTHDAGALRRAAYEASGFCARRIVEASGVAPRRIVATGGGVRDEDWVQTLADTTGLPVDCVAVPEGGALGSAWLARIAAGLEEPLAMTDGRRWARTAQRVEPDPKWQAAAAGRYERFLALTVHPFGSGAS